MSKYRIVEVKHPSGQTVCYQAQKRVLFWLETLTDFEGYGSEVWEHTISRNTLEGILEVIQEHKGVDKSSLIKTYIEVE